MNLDTYLNTEGVSETIKPKKNNKKLIFWACVLAYVIASTLNTTYQIIITIIK